MKTSIRQRLASWIGGERGETRSSFPGGPGLTNVGGFGPTTLAGASINERTSLSIAAVWGAVNCYANTISTLDFYIAERDSRGGRKPADWHPSYDAVRFRPNKKSNAMRLRQAWIGHACTFGNGYLEIVWDGSKRYPVEFHLLDPRHTKPVELDGEIWYRQTRGEDIPACDVLHLAMFGFDGLKGYSPIEVARETLGLAASQRDYQAALFNNSAQAQGHLEVAGNLDKIEQATLRKFWNKIHQGPRNAGNIGILEGGMKWVQTNFSPQDAQLILGCSFSVEEIARFWNLPQHKLNKLDKVSFSTVEEMNLDFLSTSILPWLKAIEIEHDTKIFSRSDRVSYFTHFDVKGLLRGNLAAQTAQETADLTSGVRSLNEVRRDRGDNPIPDPRADYHWIAVNNLQALETMGAATGPTATTGATEAPPAIDPTALRDVLADPVGRMLRREAQAARRAARRGELETWAGSYYGPHADVIADAIGPALRAVGAIVGKATDPAEVALRMTIDSRRQLRDLVVCVPPDELAEAVDRLCSRWEAERVGSTVDAILPPPPVPAEVP